ncbi:MAG: hypothetical protein COW71_03875 [Ignavibacteriales bacterium CG18_big_fil_WC_8_21_14_2_50_31_20]|nr:MAG: hypothetical protein COW71_03875 [Ignavibacteriales bacterium CG18_big_fil_WC_8_21_14_2_50_31_20]
MNIRNEYKAIYELNSKSPLFARVASDEVQKFNYDKAITILQNGIELFENYPTPYFLLGKLYLEIGDKTEAEECFQKGNLLLDNSKTLEFYKGQTFIQNSEIETFENSESLKNEELNLSDELENLANVLKTAKINVNIDEDYSFVEPSAKNEPDNFLPPKGLVSETLASIYYDQSNYREAKAIYETLIEIQPQRAEHFKAKIADINSKTKT